MPLILIGHGKWVLSTNPNDEQNADINATVVFYGKADTLYDLSLYVPRRRQFSNNWLVTWPFLLVLHIGHHQALYCVKVFKSLKPIFVFCLDTTAYSTVQIPCQELSRTLFQTC